ncbi:MAG: MFS transporter [Vicinamibacterales bacterium]
MNETDRNNPREIFAWTMYDWASSAFTTTVVTVLAGPYLTALAQDDVGANGVVLSLGGLGSVTATSFFPFCVSLSVFLQVVLLPLIGAAANDGHRKKPMLAALCYVGAIATCCLVFVSGDRYLLGGALFVVANLCFGASIVVYNAFLNDIATDEQRDRVSSRGFALGYLGGGLLLAVNLALVTGAGAVGITRGQAVRLSLLSAGLWWGGFALATFRGLKTRVSTASASVVGELTSTFRDLRRLPLTLRYLLAYMSYNDGIQTVISISSVFLAQELFVSRGLPADEGFLIGLILMVQFVAFGGAMAFERIAAFAGARRAILLSLVIWTGVIVYAYGFLQTTTQAWFMGAAIALVLGGSQALSRSLFSRMIPHGREASFFGLYEISERGTSWLGPLIFGIVVGTTGSYRTAILALIVLFILGLVLLLLTDTERATRDAQEFVTPSPGSLPPREPAGA